MMSVDDSASAVAACVRVAVLEGFAVHLPVQQCT